MAGMIASALAPVLLGKLIDQFETGGKVKKTGVAMVHSGEYVLPKGVAPTASQRKAVASRKKATAKKPARKPVARKPRVRKPTNNLVKTKKGKGKK
jgi:hypothetical protein